MGIRNKEMFKGWVKDWGENFVPGAVSVVEDSIRFRNEFRDGYNKCFPQKKVKIRKIDLRKPWLNDDTLKGKIKERNRLYALGLKGRLGPYEADQLRLLTSEVDHLRKSLKKTFFARQLSEAGKNSKAAWRVLHDFIGKTGNKRGSQCRAFSCGGRIITRDSEIAGSFCDFFTGIGPELAGKVRAPASDYLGPQSGLFFPYNSGGD